MIAAMPIICPEAPGNDTTGELDRDASTIAGPSRRPAAEAISKYILVDMYAKAVQAMAPVDAVKWAHGEMVKIYT